MYILEPLLMSARRIPRAGLLERDEAEEILEPHVNTLWDCLSRAFQRVQDELAEDPERRAAYDASTQAAMVYHWFARFVAQAYEDVVDVDVAKQGRMIRIRLDQRLVLRFKKLDDALRSRNVRTNTQAEMYFQYEIDGVLPVTNVTLGYTVDGLGQNMTGIYFTCPVGWSRNKWVINLAGEESGGLFRTEPSPSGGGGDEETEFSPKRTKTAENE